MPSSIIPSYTKTKANKLSKLNISSIFAPFPIRIYWMNSFAAGDKPGLISKKMHLHTFFEAHFILKGQNSYITEDGRGISLKRGSAVFFAPGQKHIVKEVGKGLVKVSLTFMPEKDSTLYKILVGNSGKAFEMSSGICANLESIFSEIPVKSSFSEEIVKNSISNIILLCVKEFSDSKDDLTYTNDADSGEIRIAVAKQYIKDNKNRFLTCKDVAEQCHFNEKYLGRLFKNATGRTLLEYIHAEKVKEAESLLSDKNMSLKDVSEALGFANEYYFNSFFRRNCGITPGQFRNLTENKLKR